MKYELIAQNKEGATASFFRPTMKSALNAFDVVYFRRGFKIEIRNTETCRVVKVIKSTYK